MELLKSLWEYTNLWDKISVICVTWITLGVVFNFTPMNTDKELIDWLLVSIAFVLCSLNTFNDILKKVETKLK